MLIFYISLQDNDLEVEQAWHWLLVEVVVVTRPYDMLDMSVVFGTMNANR
jgi:hypothetical protein